MNRFLTYASLVAAFVLTASAEYQLAVAMHFGSAVSVALPVVVDAYVLAAVRMRRELVPAIVGMAALNVVAHLVNAGRVPVNAWTISAVSVVAPLILWRVHCLIHAEADQGAEEQQPEPKTPEANAVFTPSDLRELVPALVTRAVGDQGVHSARWSAYSAEVPPAKAFTRHLEVNTGADPKVNTGSKRAAVLTALAEGHGVRAAARIAGCSPSYVSAVKRETEGASA